MSLLQPVSQGLRIFYGRRKWRAPQTVVGNVICMFLASAISFSGPMGEHQLLELTSQMVKVEDLWTEVNKDSSVHLGDPSVTSFLHLESWLPVSCHQSWGADGGDATLDNNLDCQRLGMEKDTTGDIQWHGSNRGTSSRNTYVTQPQIRFHDLVYFILGRRNSTFLASSFLAEEVDLRARIATNRRDRSEFFVAKEESNAQKSTPYESQASSTGRKSWFEAALVRPPWVGRA